MQTQDRYQLAWSHGYRAGLRGEQALIGALDRGYRSAWLAGHAQGTAARKHVDQRAKRVPATASSADYAKIRGAGVLAGRRGEPRLYGSHDGRALDAWYAGWDEGAARRRTYLPRTNALSQVFGGRIRVIP